MTCFNNLSMRWAYITERYYTAKILDVSLRGCSQVMLQNNPMSGLFFFMAIFIAAYGNERPEVAWGGVIGTVLSTMVGGFMSDSKSWKNGLYSYNGCLVGIAIPEFVAATPIMWICVIMGSIVSVVITRCLSDILKNWKVAVLTAPFVITTWIVLLASYTLRGITGTGLPTPDLPGHLTSQISYITPDFCRSIFYGISQVFLFSNILASVFFIVGLAIESVACTVFALSGSLIATSLAGFLGADAYAVHAGLYAFSAVLTSIALGFTFNRSGSRGIIYAITGVIVTVFIQAAMNTFLMPFGIPTLTMPFVITSWLFLIPNRELVPLVR